MFAKLQHRSAASPRSASSLRNRCSLSDSALDSSQLFSFSSVFSAPRIHPLSFHLFTGSPTQREARIYSVFNHLRTLSIATEGIPPLFPFWNSSRSRSAPDYAPYFQALPWGPFCKSFFLLFIHVMGGVPPSVPDHGNRPADRWQDFSLSPVTSHESPVTPRVPLQTNAFGATIRKGTGILHHPGKQLRSPRCLRLGERTLGTARSWFPLQGVPGSIVLKLDRSRVARATHPCGTES